MKPQVYFPMTNSPALSFSPIPLFAIPAMWLGLLGMALQGQDGTAAGPSLTRSTPLTPLAEIAAVYAIIACVLFLVIVVLVVAYLIGDWAKERKKQRAVERERLEAANKKCKEEAARETERWIKAEQERIKAEQKRINAEQERMQREEKHWRMWRDFLDGDTLVVPETIWPVDDVMGSDFLWTSMAVQQMKQCKARGEAWTRDNLLKGLEDVHASTATTIVATAIHALTTVRRQLDGLALAA